MPTRIIASLALLALLCADVLGADVPGEARAYVAAAVKAGRDAATLTKYGDIVVAAVDDERLTITSSQGKQKLTMPIAWTALDDRDLFELLRGLAGRDDVDGWLLLAPLAPRLGRTAEVDRELARLRGEHPRDGERIDAARAVLADDLAQAGRARKDAAAAKVAADAERKAKLSARVNQDGRALPPLPKITRPVQMNSPEADAIMSAVQLFPKTSAYNEDVSKRPVHPDSAKIIATMDPQRKLFPCAVDTYVIVPPDQAKVEVTVGEGKDRHVLQLPVPDDAAIQPFAFGTKEHAAWQYAGDGDRHMHVFDPANHVLYEFYSVFRTKDGWTANAMGAFDTAVNPRVAPCVGSACAGGISMVATTVRYDEVMRGMVEHAVRVTAEKTHKKDYLYPADTPAQWCGTSDEPYAPMFGQRFRLKADVDLSKLGKQAKAIALGLKKYGLILMDNGRDWDFGLTADPRFDMQDILTLWTLHGSDFEVVVSTGADEGPRAAEAAQRAAKDAKR